MGNRRARRMQHRIAQRIYELLLDETLCVGRFAPILPEKESVLEGV